MNKFELMDKATELYTIQNGSCRPDYPYLAYRGLLYPSELFFAYRRPCVHLEICVNATPEQDVFVPFACISSIDDSGCSMFGQKGTIEEAEATVEKVKEYFMDLNHPFQCPTLEELTDNLRPLGMHPVVW